MARPRGHDAGVHYGWTSGQIPGTSCVRARGGALPLKNVVPILRRRPWVTVVLLAAVLLAVATVAVVRFDAHGEQRGDDAALGLLLQEFEDGGEVVHRDIEVLDRLLRATSRFFSVPEADRPQVSPDWITTVLIDVQVTDYETAPSAVLDSLMEERGLDLVTDPDLNGLLLAWSLVIRGLPDDREWFEKQRETVLEPAVSQGSPIQRVSSQVDTILPIRESPVWLWNGPVGGALDDRRLRAEGALRQCRHLEQLQRDIVRALRREMDRRE